ncbi:MAG: hypothetical protein H7831_07190 [Magnetococcus sp. WYHC-3]
MTELVEYIGEIPNISGSEASIAEAVARGAGKPLFQQGPGEPFAGVRATFACALHMHQPLTPSGGDLGSAPLRGNLQDMMENQGIGDNHNAPVFQWCYKRMGEFVPALINEGKSPRIMLEYSGTLFHGLRRQGLHDVFDSLKLITCDHRYRNAVEWLGCPWGHAVAPSTPVQDFVLHVRAWQHHFAAIFGMEALERVRGFSPSEMALPNQPDVAYAFVKGLKDCGYQWVMVQEHTVEDPRSGAGPEQRHLPHRLVCTNSRGETASIIALIKTQGSDTKLVAQMQPYYEARSLNRWELAGRSVPPLVTQIADGENGGVMMNEFPPKYMEAMRECSHSDVPAMNGSEYLEHLLALGITEADLPVIQPTQQKKIFDRFTPGEGPEKLAQVIAQLRREDHRFHMEGGSWTSNLSWVKGYDNVLGPMEEVSKLFFEKVIQAGIDPSEARYRNALFHLMTTQTSCYRYWGQGLWTDYAREICRRTDAILRHDF